MLRVAAIVLAGGQSRRFAPDKLAELVGGQTLLDLTLSAVPAAFDVVLVGPPRPTIRPVVQVQEQPAGAGPAAALVAGLRHALARSAEALVVLPGDAPQAGAGALVLLERLTADPAVQAVVAVDDSGRLQPLQLSLSAPAAQALVDLAGAEQAANASARALLSRLEPQATPCRLPADYLFDVDTAEALERLAARPARFASHDE
jgi:molybdopterin-guanine dinucleotide biosynthesis protein A